MAMSIGMLLILMLADQKSYDSHHENKDRIYRVLMHPATHSKPYATAPFPLAESLKAQYPFLEEATSLRRGFGGDAVYQKKYAEMKGYFTDASFLKTFSISLEAGDPSTALNSPNSIIISRQIADQLFEEDNPLGKVIDYTDRGLDSFTEEGSNPVEWGRYTVTGIFDDTGYKSHLEFDVLVSASSQEILYKQEKISDISDNWSNYYQSYVYALVKPQASAEQLQSALDSLVADKYTSDESLLGSTFIAQPLVDITPGSALGNAPTTRLPLFVYYILAALALVIMISACLNYTNLSIARALTRAKEIGVRKVNGAKRKDLVFQFLSEATITVLLALAIAFVFLFFVKSAFLKLWVNQYLNFDLNVTLEVVLLSLGFALLVGIIAGIFPALHLSGYNPVRALRNLKLGQPGRLGLRKVLTTIQFGLSLLFIITAIVVFNQFRHFMQFEYGFNPDNVLLVNLQSNDYELAKTAFSRVSGVDDVAGCAYLPATGRNDNTRLKKPGSSPEEEGHRAINVGVDESFIRTLEINLIAGKNLPPAGSGLSSMILVNEATANVLGYDNPLDIVGESLETSSDTLQVAGVVEDFTFHLLFNGRPIGPVIMRHVPETFKFLSVKIGSGREKETLARLEEAWKAIDPIHPLAYEYYEDKLANYNRGIFDIATVIGFIALLAITIACLGLLGMATYTTERRTKEVGIRKVLGAGDIRLAYLLSKEFLIILGIAIVIAAPLSYFLNNLWLNFLVTRVEFGPGTLLTGSLLLLLLGLVTIVPQTLRISLRNPVDSLRNE